MARRAKPKKLKYKKPARRKYYGRGYSHGSSKFRRFKWPLIILAAAILIFVIISVAPAFAKLITGQLTSNSSSQQSVSSDIADISSEGTSSNAVSDETTKLITSTLPVSAYGDETAVDDFIAQAKADGATAVAVVVKDADGNVYFENAKASSYGAVTDSALDLESVVSKITENNMTPVAVMHAFSDPIAAQSRDNCYMYIDGSSMWLDNSLANNGKPWLSVNSSSAKKYLYSLENDLLEAGFKQIIMKSVQYPDVRDSSTIAFPDGSDNQAKQQTLADFANNAISRAQKQGASLTVEFDSESVAGKKTNIYFGSPLTVSADVISPVISSSSLKGTVTIGETTVKKPLENLDDLLAAISEAASESDIIPIVYSSDKNADDIIEAIENSDSMAGYVLSDEEGE